MFAALVFLVQTAASAPAPAPRDDAPIELVIRADDAPLAQHGRATTLRWTSDFDGWLHVWASADELDVCLRVDDLAGVLRAEDSDSGELGVPYLELAVKPGDVFVIHVAAEHADDSLAQTACVQLHLGRAHESVATRAAARDLGEGLRDLTRALRENDRRGVRELGDQFSAALEHVDGWQDSTELARALWPLHRPLIEAGNLRVAKLLIEPREAHLARLLPELHPQLCAARELLANVLAIRGELQRSFAVCERLTGTYSRQLPANDPRSITAHLNFANMLRAVGNAPRARGLYAELVAMLETVSPPNKAQLRTARSGLALCLEEAGDRAGALALRKEIYEDVLATAAEDSDELVDARAEYATSLVHAGDVATARVLREQVLERDLANLPHDHPNVQAARISLANTLGELGELARAETLEREALDVYLRIYSADHPDLQTLRLNLANHLALRGALEEARYLQEQALEVDERMLPETHHELHRARAGLAITAKMQGDYAAARALEERVVASLTALLPPDHAELLMARGNLGNTLRYLGDLERAHTELSAVYAGFSATLAPDARELQLARMNLAAIDVENGDVAEGRELAELSVDAYERTLPADHPLLTMARANLASLYMSSGDETRGVELLREVAEAFGRVLPRDHLDLEQSRADLCRRLSRKDHRAEIVAELDKLTHDLAAGALVNARVFTPRQLDEYVAQRNNIVWSVLWALRNENGSEPITELTGRDFELVETLRGAGLVSARLLHAAGADAGSATLVDAARTASTKVAQLCAGGADADALLAAVRAKETAERALLARLERTHPADVLEAPVSVARVAAELAPGAAAMSFVRYSGAVRADAASAPLTPSDLLLAFVVHADSTVQRVELGALVPIAQAVEGWRAAVERGDARGVERGLGATAPAQAAAVDEEFVRGDALRALVFDPLHDALAGARALWIVPDDVLQLVPFDALPCAAADGPRGTRLGDRYALRVCTALWELTEQAPARAAKAEFVGFGGADFDVATAGSEVNAQPAAATLSTDAPLKPATFALASRGAGAPVQLLRGASGRTTFPALPATDAEVLALERLWRDSVADASEVRLGPRATTGELASLAPRATYLHLATHGFVAAESASVGAGTARGPATARLLTAPFQFERRLSPLALCGLALAGANGAPDALGNVPGVITAEEIASLDLAHCELAVLSACDTNLGVMRAGVGIACLQRALHLAGARSVITAAWSVPDDATRMLMSDFYRRLWVEKQSPHTALWAAKTALRNVKDARGLPKYSTRDWGAWVLSGAAD